MDLFFVIYVSRLSLLCCLIYSLQPCNHPLGTGPTALFDLLFVMFSCVFVTFPYGVSGECGT